MIGVGEKMSYSMIQDYAIAFLTRKFAQDRHTENQNIQMMNDFNVGRREIHERDMLVSVTPSLLARSMIDNLEVYTQDDVNRLVSELGRFENHENLPALGWYVSGLTCRLFDRGTEKIELETTKNPSFFPHHFWEPTRNVPQIVYEAVERGLESLSRLALRHPQFLGASFYADRAAGNLFKRYGVTRESMFPRVGDSWNKVWGIGGTYDDYRRKAHLLDNLASGRQSGELVINGNVGDFFAKNLEGGRVTLNGSTGWRPAYGMGDAYLHIIGDCGVGMAYFIPTGEAVIEVDGETRHFGFNPPYSRPYRFVHNGRLIVDNGRLVIPSQEYRQLYNRFYEG